jgi:type II secretion system protein I
MTPEPYTCRRAGFTLLEVLVAVIVIAVSFTGLLALHNRNLRLVGQDQNLTRATLLMRDMIAQLELYPEYLQLGSASGASDVYPELKWEREVNPTQFEDLREVKVRVHWGERGAHGAELLYYAHYEEPLE